MKAVTGNYLFNSDESIGISFVENEMIVRWRGNDNIKPLKVNDSTFYIKAMNEKFVFIMQPKVHIVLAKKREHEGKTYAFNKMQDGEKTPREYLFNKEYDKALAGYLSIQQKDSLDKTIRESTINSLGYNMLNDKKHNIAIETFKINIKLYPKSSNTYDSLADAFLRKKDTVNAINYYNKALSINPENSSSRRMLKRITKK
ncbi:tetratricopeptide repeat protein [Polaribacter uvawellassae]|uniref:tetratricopeptide repeat protein n=1 Tax=Polaribacter uvawellassae TaxID=3133495 RepID=UPI003219FDB1